MLNLDKMSMKQFNKMRLIITIVCAILVETCSGEAHIEYGVRDRTFLSQRFLDDMKEIADNFYDNIYVTDTVNRLMGKLTNATKSPSRQLDLEMIQAIADETNEIDQNEITMTLKTMLLKKLPPKNVMGILNILQAIRPSAPVSLRTDVIRYLYGNFSFPNNISINVLTNCVLNRRLNLTALNFLVDINPQVIEDILNITNTFSCNQHVMSYMERTVQQLTVDLKGTHAIIDVCGMSRYSKLVENLNIQDYYSRTINKVELILSTKLPKERYANLLNFSRSCLPGAEDLSIWDASMYLYGYVRVPEVACQRRRFFWGF